MPQEDEAAISAREDAEIASGFTDKSPPPPAKKPDAAPAKPDAPPAHAHARASTDVTVAPPEFVQISRKDWDEVRAAAAKTASYDAQLSKVFGTLGNLQKVANSLQASTPAGRKVEIPKDAFAAMERDFPELAQQTRAALEAALSGLSGTGGGAAADTGTLEAMLASHTAKRELEVLEDAYPEWRRIVGAVDASREKPDPNNPFRRWLATKDAAYQIRINGSESASVIGRAIRLFQNETKAGARAPLAQRTPDGLPTARALARTERISAAVQPRGDNAVANAGPSDDEQFEAGFRSR